MQHELLLVRLTTGLGAKFLQHGDLPHNVQITGGHKYLPPRQDVNAPDLYIPFMAVCTFCLLACMSKLVHALSRLRACMQW